MSDTSGDPVAAGLGVAQAAGDAVRQVGDQARQAGTQAPDEA